MVHTLFKRLGLTSKDHRERLRHLIQEEARAGVTLDIGANFYNKEQYHEFFENITTLNIVPQKGIELDVIGDAHALPFSDHSFDNILCTEVLEHLHTPWIAVSEMFRVLKPGGKVILSTPFVMPLHDVPGDFFRYTPYGLKSLFSKFERIEVQAVSTSFQTLFILFQRISYQTDWGTARVLKPLFLMLAKLIGVFQYAIKGEYGDIERKEKINSIMSSGYFLTAYKPL